ncbi:hypothetical protein GCK32_003915, partial [Trichostrongylus colubriformis]
KFFGAFSTLTMENRRNNGGDALSNWINIGDVKIKFVKNYSDLPTLRLKHAIHFAACTYSGPLALAFSNSESSWFIDIVMSGGGYLKQKLEVPDVFAMEWTKGHRLIVMDRRGNASLFSALGDRVSEFHFGNGVRELREVRVFPTARDSGIATLDDQARIFVVNSVSEPIVWSMQNSGRQYPNAWTVLQPRSQLTQVIVAVGTTFYSGCQGEQLSAVETPFAESDGQYARMAVSSDHSMIALYHSSRRIQVVSIDLSQQISRITVPGEESIFRFGWVGQDALFLQRTPLFVQFFGVHDENAHYDLQTNFTEIGVESDGIKLYTEAGMEFVSTVSRDERAVLGVASASDGALLYEAAQWLNTNKSHQSYEYAMQIRDLALAIEQCIATASSAWSPELQKALLKAAHFGMAFSNGYDSNRFARFLRELRVLNEVHRRRIGMPITYSQFQELGESCLINRLIDVGAYGLAAEICSWLKRDQQEGIDRVLLEWVRRTVNKAASSSNTSELNMQALDEKIANKLMCYPHVSLAEALTRAAAAQRPQLMHQVVRHLMKGQKRAEYELAIRKIPLAQCLYQDLIREESDRGSGKMMLALLEQASDFERQTMFHLDAVESELNPAERLNYLRRAKESARNMGDKGVEELLTDMAAFAPGQSERGQDQMTIRDTVVEFAADPQKVAQFKHQAKLTDKQVWLWTIEGLAKTGKMEQLFDMAQKKSPVGYVPFIKACIKYNRREESKKYFAKVHGYQELVAANLAMGNFVAAAKMAFDRRDRETLQLVFMKAHSDKEAYSKMASRFWRSSEVLMNGTIAVSLYRSTRSRLVVAIGDVPGPLVKGCISFVTEADTDDGLPHTLEHLVFMGSKKYPYKGVLDIIANRCLASGTNAWTDQDHTAYTLSTVGSEGFFKVLPVYLNHLLSPMLSQSQFATEVHHINGKGEDAGVVYSEMQDHESEMSCIMDRRVRNFHKKYYHLSNMMVTVSGRVDHERLLKIIETTEEEHLSEIPASFQRPFMSHKLKPMAESSVHRVVCPSDDESRGSVEISWFGHRPTDFQEKVAFDVLFDYMSNTPVSPLQREFILIEKPLASQVYFHVSEQTTCLIQLTFSGVPTKRLDDVNRKFMEKVVKEHLEDKTWDMERMGFLFGQSVKNMLKEMEKNPATHLFGHMIGHQLYDENDDQLKTRMDELELLRRLRSEAASFWSGLVKKYFTSPHVVVIGVPSEKMVDQVAKEEKNRLDQQCKKLGEEGIKRCGEKIEAAIKENTAKKPSAEVLKELIVKKLEQFDRFPVDSKCNRGGSPSSQPVAKFLDQFPFPATVHNCPTKFVELFFLFDTTVLTVEQRALLDLYTELLFESPAKIDGEVKSAEEVSKLYTRDLVDHSIYVGVSGNFEKFLQIRIVVDAETGFPNLAKWAEIFTTGIVFDVQRVKQCAKKLASNAREKKRDGSAVASTALDAMVYLYNSNGHMYDELVLEKFHEKIAKECDSKPNDVLKRLEELRSALFSNGVNAHLLCNVDLIDTKLFDPVQWKFAEKFYGNAEKFKVKAGETIDTACIGKQKVISVGGSESSFIYQLCMMDCDWLSAELVPTMLFTQYLSQCEGPLWRGIRGVGLAYSVSIYVRSDRKTITLSLYRCAQPAQAYEETKKIVLDVIKSGKVVDSEFEAAKRSLICDLVEPEDTVSSLTFPVIYTYKVSFSMTVDMRIY